MHGICQCKGIAGLEKTLIFPSLFLKQAGVMWFVEILFHFYLANQRETNIQTRVRFVFCNYKRSHIKIHYRSKLETLTYLITYYL